MSPPNQTPSQINYEAGTQSLEEQPQQEEQGKQQHNRIGCHYDDNHG
jgi:hypothetical protein